MPSSRRLASIIQRLLPVLGWLPAYRRDWLLPDVLAGLAVWAVMVPEGMAYAAIVGVPPIMGLYTIIPPLIGYALLGTSRLLVVGPDTATGLISALTVGAIATQGTTEFNTLTSTLAILIGAFFLLFGALRMGWVAAFIPTPVMRGFIDVTWRLIQGAITFFRRKQPCRLRFAPAPSRSGCFRSSAGFQPIGAHGCCRMS